MLLLWRGALGLVIGAAAGAAALLTAYWLHPGMAMEMDRGASPVIAGLYDVERVDRQTFAWTRQHATLTLPGLDRRTEWTCTIRLRGGRADQSTLPEVMVSVDGVITATHPTSNDYRDVEVTLPARPLNPGATVMLTASSTFSPGSSDTRMLGLMIDRWTCAPAAGAFVWPPRRILTTAIAGGAIFGAAFALIGAGTVVTLGAAALLAAAQAIPLAWEFGMFTAAYPGRGVTLAIWIAGLLCLSVYGVRWATGRPLSGAARIVLACTAAILYLKLLVLLHPSKPPIDVVFHAHRLQWVLDGRFYFTQPMPSGVQFPYAIGLYVFTAPWTLLTADYVLLLRIVVSAAEAVGAVLVYLLVSRVWQDRFAAAAAALLFHLVPRTFEIVGNANMTNAFAQSVALAALTAAVLWPLQRSNWVQVIALTAITALALLSHISTLTLLGAILLTLSVLYWLKGGPGMRRPALSLFAALVVAAGLSVAVYYAHFGDAYRTAARVRASNAAAASPASAPATPGTAAPAATQPPVRVGLPSKLADAGRLTVAAVGWPIFMMALACAVPFWRRGFGNRLSLAILALLITFVMFVLSVVVMPVERSFQRYAAEFISRVTLATYPAMVILAGASVAAAWRAGWFARVVAGTLMLSAVYVGVVTWIEWLR